MTENYIPLKETYDKEVIPSMIDKFSYSNKLEVPKLVKISINMGIGEGSKNPDLIEMHAKELAELAGQKPVVTLAKKSIANFKIRRGMPLGLKVTLRGTKMHNFLYKLINVVLPKLRDFRGVNPDSFDGRGNFSVGLPEQLVFPEITPANVKRVQGMDIIIVTTADTDEEARELLRLFGMPFKQQK